MVLLSAVAAVMAAPLASAQLHELAVKAGKKYFGTATDTGELSNTTYYKILTDTKEFGQLTPSNGQKVSPKGKLARGQRRRVTDTRTQWQFIEPELGVFNFTEGEFVTNVAAKTGQMLRCHNTVWHNQLAPWVESTAWDRANFTAMLRQHVYNEVAHWKGRCYAWDVVNEGLEENGTYRADIFYNTLGDDYFKIAFEEAARADPSAKLYYNDYNIETPGPKQEGVLRIIDLLQSAGLRIDGVGLQSHFVAGSTPSRAQQVAAMRSYAAKGLEVAQTELDIRIELPLNASNLAQQKQDYKTSVQACMQVKECVGVTVWDFYDPVGSWSILLSLS